MKDSNPKPHKKARPLNLRDFPDELYWKCKVRAAEQHITLKQFVVEVLKKELAA